MMTRKLKELEEDPKVLRIKRIRYNRMVIVNKI